MVSFEKLHQQNHKITELTNILEHLLGDRSLCDSKVTCDLFFEYVSAVKDHLAVTDSAMYSKLLGSGDQKMSNVANRFMGGSREINRIFSAYLKRWCKVKSRTLVIREYDAFMRDTEGAEGFVHIHSGIHGTGDLSPAEWDWQNPVVEIAVIEN